MDFQQIHSFLAVARYRSFTIAAQELGLTQSGVSRQVQKLEQEIEATLLERRQRTVELTPAGERFQAYAEETLDKYARLQQQLKGNAQALIGELRIAASTTPGEFLVPDLVAGFTTDNPEVHPEVFITDSSEVIAELREGRWDVGFVGARLPGRGLQYDVVAEDEVVLIVPSTHPFGGREEILLEELAKQPFIEREGGSGTLHSVRAALTKLGLTFPQHRVVMSLNTTHAVLSAVAAGHGIGWVSSLAVERTPTKRVATVRLKGMPLRRSLYIVHEKQRILPPIARAFVEWVRQGSHAGEERTTAN